MNLPVPPPVAPMLAKRVDDIPDGDSWIFEPKWDGFRTLVFRDGDDLMLQSRDQKSLNRYFPELFDPLKSTLPERCVLDGEIVIAASAGLDGARGQLDFDALQLRIHPAASRIKLLSQQIPASIVFFDLLAVGDDDLTGEPFEKRRATLESLLAKAKPPIHITPATRDLSTARDWFKRFEGAGLDGVIAKPVDGIYTPNKRTMLKVKHERDCDCVVAGFRWHKDAENEAVGSLLLGLYDASGSLQHVGVCASFTQKKRRELVEFLEPYRKNALKDHPWRAWNETEASGGENQRMPGGQSRWSQGKDLSWQPLRPELVVEVAYEHMQGTRFRHMAQFRRWRTDKPPEACTYEQLEVVAPHELASIFARP
ncbi:ATP-dependent DNA ligase [Edaphobacter sp. HDX4]|uniref:ATP-dependent DNA ligase n=1 Tax=Edaphobacter sp. HDX4 TaxID=2794064 RepID=UPI002FE5FEEF